MITQLLCGETYEIADTSDEWSLIRISADASEGWIHQKMISLIPSDRFHFIINQEPNILKDPVYQLPAKTGLEINWIPGGSTFIREHGVFMLGDKKFQLPSETALFPIVKNKTIPSDALNYIHSPYLWGGKSIFGMDCSGFTQVVFKMNGLQLPRDAYQQAIQGELISRQEDIKPGDLAFFNRGDGRIIHTGIMLDRSTIIHASGKVRIDTIDTTGIIQSEDKTYSHHLSHFRRIN